MHNEGDPVWVQQQGRRLWHLTRWAAEGYGVRPPACGVRALAWVPFLAAGVPERAQQCAACLHIATLAARREAAAGERA